MSLFIRIVTYVAVLWWLPIRSIAERPGVLSNWSWIELAAIGAAVIALLAALKYGETALTVLVAALLGSVLTIVVILNFTRPELQVFSVLLIKVIALTVGTFFDYFLKGRKWLSIKKQRGKGNSPPYQQSTDDASVQTGAHPLLTRR